MISHSQAGQDLFVFEASGRKPFGTFIDIGCNDPVVHSNTYALEEEGWRGLLVDIIPCAGGRKSLFLQIDATRDISEIVHFWHGQTGGLVDYVSLDVDDATESAFSLLPFEDLLAGVVTIEHDRYRLGDRFRNLARERMARCGYILARGDVVAPGYGEYEDWFKLPWYPKP